MLPHAVGPVHGLQVTPSAWHRLPLGHPVVVPGVHVFPADEEEPMTLELTGALLLLTSREDDETTTALLLLTTAEEDGGAALLLGGAADDDGGAREEETVMVLVAAAEENRGPDPGRLVEDATTAEVAALAPPDAEEEPPALDPAEALLVPAVEDAREVPATLLPPLEELVPTTPEEAPTLPEEPLEAPGVSSQAAAVHAPLAQLYPSPQSALDSHSLPHRSTPNSASHAVRQPTATPNPSSLRIPPVIMRTSAIP